MKRAEQLGFKYPRVNDRETINAEILNVLFVCSMNKWRSPTAEKIYQMHPLVNCRSAGTSSKARHSLTIGDIHWSDLIVVMEQKHYERIAATYRDALRYKEIEVLDVKDRYKYMDPELVEELRLVLDPILLVESE